MSPAVGQSDSTNSANALDIDRIRAAFPALHQEVHGKPLVYLDNAATTQKPDAVISCLRSYYEQDNSNVHRGIHTLSERATESYENTRNIIARYVGADDSRRVVFTRGTTEAINLVAYSFVEPRVSESDEIIVSEMEHHSNIVPWQLLAERTGAVLRVAPVKDDGSLDLDATLELINDKTSFVSVVYVSNSLGTINPIRQLIDAAHAVGAPILVDGAQAMAHAPIAVDEWGADFFAFSGHKVYGPTGIGALVGRMEHLEAMRPYQSGGDMIRRVSFSGTELNDIPYRFEAGTPNIAGTIGLGSALEFVESIGREAIAAHESAVLDYAFELASNLSSIRILGRAPDRAAVLSFVLGDIHAHDVGTILDTEGVAVRAGHHCTMPIMERFGVPATARASIAMYNTREEMDTLFAALAKVEDIFR